MDFEFDKVMIFFAHPDDGEFMAGGSTAKWASEGKQVALVVVTNGSHGSNDPSIKRDDLIESRQKEQRQAAAITGASEIVFLGYEDCYVEDSHELRRDMIREIRRFKPDVVIGPDPSLYHFPPRYINHPDHRAVGAAFCAAVNPGAATLPIYRQELYDKGFEPHELKAALLGFSPSSNYFVDITDHIDKKIEAVMVHSTQTPEFSADMAGRMKEMGSAIADASGQKMTYAEGYTSFIFHTPPNPPSSTMPSTPPK